MFQTSDIHTRSLQLSSRWAAADAHRGIMSQMRSPLRMHTGGQLAGTQFFQGTVHDPQSRRYNDLLAAQTIAAGGTLHAYHVNLESNIGQYLKQSMDLPFRPHSQVDPLKAADQAAKMFGGDILGGLPSDAAAIARGRLTEAVAGQSTFIEGLIAEAKGKNQSLAVLALNKFGPALEAFKGEFSHVLGAGAEALAVQTKAGDVLKFSVSPLEAGMGQRLFDAPVLRHGTLLGAGPDPVHYSVQPKVEIAKTAEESQRFFGELAKSGYSILDPGERQFGYYQGKPMLIDYSSVTAPHGEAEFPTRAPARPIPTAENFRVTPTGLVREEIVPGSTVPSFRRPSQESPAQATHYQSLKDALRRESIEGKAIGAPVKSITEAAETVAAKETLHELHTNLESGAGKFLKKLFKLPFKERSRSDALKAAFWPGEMPGGAFVGKVGVIAGIAAAGALTLVGVMNSARQNNSSQVQPVSTSETHGYRDRHEKRRDSIKSRHKSRGRPKARTTLDVRDHPLDMRQVDEAFTNHMKTGFARSSSYD